MHVSKVSVARRQGAISNAVSRRLVCQKRSELEAALQLLGEQPAWTVFANYQDQHRCRPAGRYDQTVVNWFSGTGRITCQGLNSAALELHMEGALRGVQPNSPLQPEKRTQTLAIETTIICDHKQAPVPFESTPDSKSGSIDSTSAGTPSDDSDLSTVAPLVPDVDVKTSAGHFNDKLSGVTAKQTPFPYPFPPLGLVGQTAVTRSMSASALPQSTSTVRSRGRALRARSCEP